MLLKKERLQEIDRMREQNQKWKDEIDKQIRERQLKKLNDSIINQELQRIEDEKIKQYQQLVNQRTREGSYSKGKKELKTNSTKMGTANTSVLGAAEKDKTEKLKTYNSKRKLSVSQDEQIPLFPAIDSGKIAPSVAAPTTKADKTDDEPIVLSFPEQSARKKRKSTAKKRQDTVQSRRNTENTNVIENELLEEQNKKLKEELRKANTAVESIMKLLRSHPGLQYVVKQAEDLILGKEIGYTQYIKIENSSVHHSPSKALFPSLDFKTSPIISQFNIVAAKKANVASSAEFKHKQKEK